MSKGKPLGMCKTCGSEIVDSVNDGVFGGGECDYCERMRYETQPALLEAVTRMRNLTESLDYEDGDDDDRLRAMESTLDTIRDLGYAVIRSAEDANLRPTSLPKSSNEKS